MRKLSLPLLSIELDIPPKYRRDVVVVVVFVVVMCLICHFQFFPILCPVTFFSFHLAKFGFRKFDK